MTRAAVMIDDWKEDRFVKALTDAGFEHEVKPGLVDGTRTIAVEVDPLKGAQEVNRLSALIQRTNREAQASRAN